MYSRVCIIGIELECTKLDKILLLKPYENYEKCIKIEDLDMKFSNFSPFIRLWVVFLDWITQISMKKSVKSKLTNISYKDMQNLSSPSDCIQFSVSDNERMIMSFIIHISDLRNSTFNWCWGIEIKTGFEYLTTPKHMIDYLS